jgi:hypothetical protein
LGLLDKIKDMLSGPSRGAASQIDQSPIDQNQTVEDKTDAIGDATGGPGAADPGSGAGEADPPQ